MVPQVFSFDPIQQYPDMNKVNCHNVIIKYNQSCQVALKMFSPALHLTRRANSFTVLSCGFIQVHTPSLATIKTWQRWQTRLDDPCDAPGPAARPCLQKAVPLLSSSQTLRGWRNNLKKKSSRSLVVISLFFQFFTEHDWPIVIYWIYCYLLLPIVDICCCNLIPQIAVVMQ